jgi:hypothetical protein
MRYNEEDFRVVLGIPCDEVHYPEGGCLDDGVRYIVEELIILDGVPDTLFIPRLRLNVIHLRNKSPHNSKKRKYDNVVKHTIISPVKRGCYKKK